MSDRILSLFGKTLKSAPIDFALTGDQTIIAAVPGRRIKVYAIMLNTVLALTVRFKSGGNNLTGAIALGVNSVVNIATAAPSFLLATNIGEAFVMNLGTAIQASGFVSYWDDDSF